MRRISILTCFAAVLTAACGASGTDGAPPDDDAEAAVTSSTGQPPTTTTTSLALDVAWGDLEVIGPDMTTPGHFRTADGFMAPFHASIPETVKFLGGEASFLLLIPSEEEYTPSDDLDTGVTRAFLVTDMGLGTVPETLEWFESQPTMTTSERSAAMIGGIKGTTIDVTTTELVTVPDSGQYFEPNWVYRPTLVDLDGTTVAVFVEAHQDEFDGFWDDVQPILQTLTWAPERYVEPVGADHVLTPGSVEDGLGLTVELEIPDPAPDVPTGPFRAAGTAVDAGWFCAEGTYTQLSYAELDPDNAIETWEMKLDCGDSEGSITVKVESQGQPIPDGWQSDNEWTVSDSGGDLAGATGVGDGFSECMESICLDLYEGRLLIPSATYFEFTVEAPDEEDFDAVFSATGEAVDGGVICSEGPVFGGEYSEDEWPIAVWTIGVGCDDPAGEFTVDVVAEVSEEADEFHTVGTWTLIEPSGVFAESSGGGDLSTVCADGWCVDVYFGWLTAG